MEDVSIIPQFFVVVKVSPEDITIISLIIVCNRYQERKRHSPCSKASFLAHWAIPTCIKLVGSGGLLREKSQIAT